jgi:hypothetical protein
MYIDSADRDHVEHNLMKTRIFPYLSFLNLTGPDRASGRANGQDRVGRRKRTNDGRTENRRASNWHPGQEGGRQEEGKKVRQWIGEGSERRS